MHVRERIFDPVCGIALEPDETVVEHAVEGHTLFFCSEWCRDRFKKDPTRYSGTPIIQMRGVHKTFGKGTGATHVLRGVDLNIWEGDFVSIVGASGSGKSTVLNLIGNLDKATEGEIRIRGKAITQMADEERAQLRSHTFGFVFQQYNLIPWLSALENAMVPTIFAGEGRSARLQALRERFASIDLEHRLHHRPFQLSGGEQQRVALVRALANDPDIILGDEPTGNLDSKTGEKILQILRDLNADNNKTLVIVTHDQNIAEMADHTIVLKDGRVVRNHTARRRMTRRSKKV